MSLSVDPRNVYNPPSSLQYPGAEEDSPARPESPPSTSSSHSDLSSPSFNRDSEIELNPKALESLQSTNVSLIIWKFISYCISPAEECVSFALDFSPLSSQSNIYLQTQTILCYHRQHLSFSVSLFDHQCFHLVRIYWKYILMLTNGWSLKNIQRFLSFYVRVNQNGRINYFILHLTQHIYSKINYSVRRAWYIKTHLVQPQLRHERSDSSLRSERD